ncbi:Ig-specific serine endopeptidase MIP [Mycoplasmopsis bovis]|uniref:Ig-specific serine endopeptidase MIP n=1 Tax=Mycoplasmopsis bovis TaxID=28903 RepID=UPI00126035C6|nr:hypothetical protein [Mycoplasmopsis bovis]MBT1368959.1 hypothetical protein [Mycoplasmopsis bovis]MCA8841015.1 hypothetical protein [Mycoplasmopsis bovis]MCA8844146.1 hypothetical protein [Mycoplasmopsis bovis]MCA8844907.1 hypothetical protein [Mycoplasmopsis bovis]MCA8846478.1 hypothetical protein [Mycoplasmopsis bovis]
MKQQNKILLIASASILSPASVVVAAKCNTSNKPNSTTDAKISDLSSEDFKNLIEKTNDYKSLVTLQFGSSGRNIPLSDLLPSQIEDDSQNLRAVVNDKYADVIDAIIVNATTEKKLPNIISNVKGELSVSINFKNKKTNENIAKTFKVTGLKTNGGLHHSGLILRDPEDSFNGAGGFKNYLGWNQNQRFEYDNKLYINSIRNWWGGGDILKTRGFSATEEQKKRFDELAKTVGFDSYENAAIKGFSLPVYGSNGQVSGLRLLDSEVGKIPSHVDTLGRELPKTNGLARTIPNQTYQTIAKQTYQITFHFKKDFKRELAKIEEYIEFFNSKNEQQIKDYLEKEIQVLTNNHKFALREIEKRWASLSEEAKRGLEDSHKREIEEENKKYEAEKAKYSSWKKEDLIKWQNDEKRKIEEKKQTGELGDRVSGTIWIMDYQLPDTGKTATKFYFGTNSHVAKILKEHELTGFSLSRVDENVGVHSTFKFNDLDPNFKKFSFTNPKNMISNVFDAVDFMNTSPKNYIDGSQKEEYKDTEEYIDFAVIEIDFEKLNPSEVTIWSENRDIGNTIPKKGDRDELIKLITNNYQTDTKNHIKFKSKSYLDNYNEIDVPLAINDKDPNDINKWNEKEGLFILGYPRADKDFYLDRYIDEEAIKVAKENYSLWVNGDHKWYKKLATPEGQQPTFPDYTINNGGRLSYQIGYRTFTDKPGLTDGFLAAPRIGNEFYSITDKSSNKTVKYVNYGLHLMPRFYAPYGGASGSSVRNKKNELIAVYHSSNDGAKTGLAAVFRSPGKNYNKLFGDYNLPQYDLIYGGGKDQKNSYRQALKEKYKDMDGFKTKLFSNGFDESNIPPEFRFNNTK